MARDDYPREGAYTRNGDPLWMNDGNQASAADVHQHRRNMRVYDSNGKIYSGAVYDGDGHRVRQGWDMRYRVNTGSDVGDSLVIGVGIVLAIVLLLLVGILLIIIGLVLRELWRVWSSYTTEEKWALPAGVLFIASALMVIGGTTISIWYTIVGFTLTGLANVFLFISRRARHSISTLPA